MSGFRAGVYGSTYVQSWAVASKGSRNLYKPIGILNYLILIDSVYSSYGIP